MTRWSVAYAGVALVACSNFAKAAQLTLAQNYSGSSFFDGWTFQNGIDANTTGNVLYQTREQATGAQQLAFVNSAGHAIIKVDNTTSGANDPQFGRPSVKILSNSSVPAGSLILMDAVHMPFGCSVWPAFWTQGVNWPDDGEIDIMENVNLATTNRYTLHTLNGCMHPPDGQGPTETGTVVSTDCFNQTNGDEGCIVQDSSTNSYGPGFAANGGGVFATLWDDQGIRIWFFERANIPADVPTENPNPDGWGTPTAFFPISSCDTSKFFGLQTLIFDITICGNFAGAPDVFNPSCPGVCTDMVANPANYNDAYFEINYVRVFTNGTKEGTTPGSSGGGSNSGPGGGDSGNGAAALYGMSLSSALVFASSVALVAMF